jgi:hypothetical protein
MPLLTMLSMSSHWGPSAHLNLWKKLDALGELENLTELGFGTHRNDAYSGRR